MGCSWGQSHFVRSPGRLIADVPTSGEFCGALELRSSYPRLSTGSAPAAATSMEEIRPSVGWPDSRKAAT